MSEWIIAAVGVGGALAGSAITGAFTLGATNKQSEAQHAAELRQSRRAAYTNFLARMDEVERSYQVLWERPADQAGHLAALEAVQPQVVTADLALNDLSLEGPSRVTEAAERFRRVHTRAYIVLLSQMGDALRGGFPAGTGLKDVDGHRQPAFDEAQRYAHARAAFVSVAKTALGTAD